jgi:8-oxo-dGTP pyrophosphatase MutT (NUDIX family)
MVWKPNVTVAAVIERGGRFLLVEERTEGGLMLNQPAGHLELGESLVQGVVRETLEETAYDFHPRYVLGIYRWRKPGTETTYLRFAFTGDTSAHHPARALDDGIVRTLWLSAEEIRKSKPRHRSPLVVDCMEAYLQGRRFPLEIFFDYD